VAQSRDVSWCTSERSLRRFCTARHWAGHGEAPAGFILAITIWLLFTVLFANFAEALAEGRSRAQAASLRGLRHTVFAKKLLDPTLVRRETTRVMAEELRKGDVVLIEGP